MNPSEPVDPVLPVTHATRTEVYKTIGDVRLTLHIFEPPDHQDGDRRPAIVFFFGGGWVGGQPRQFQPHCAYLASRGMVAITAEYRVKKRHNTTPIECVKDGKSAIRYVRANAATFGIDPDRIVAAGGSAGGHVAACTGVVNGFDEDGQDTAISSRPNAMALFNPGLVMGSIEGVLALPAEHLAMLAGRFGASAPDSLSPYNGLTNDAPPTIIFHGEADTTVPLITVQAYEQKARSLGARCELHTYPGEGHGFFNFGREGNRAFLATLQATDEFLASLGYLSGPPTLEDFPWPSLSD